MPEHDHDENDLKLMREMRKLAPEDFNAWLELNNIIGRENGAIPKKYRELSPPRWKPRRNARTAWKRTPRPPRARARRAKKWSKRR
jgi:hypothetical protein